VPGSAAPSPIAVPAPASAERWAKVIDHTRCIGCHACSTACKSENGVPLGVNRTYVKYVDVGRFPQARRAFQVTRCNQCEDPPCAEACPTAAMHQRQDGIVDFDKSICIGCKACIAACPYDAIFINPDDHCAEKCNLCAHRLEVGLEPACVTVCPTQAIAVGDLADPTSPIARAVGREVVSVRKPEKGTRPKLFYKGAHQATLDPLAAKRPPLYLWSERPEVPGGVPPGHPGDPSSAAAAMLAYDVPHRAPWDWRVSLYTWTKGIAAGAWLVPALLVLAGVLPAESALWRLAAPLVALAFLGATGAILVLDLEHPARFWLIFARRQWRSWLVRGAVVITGYGAVLTLHLGCALLLRRAPPLPLVAAGILFSAATAIYTAWLFAQARARDLWQSPLLPAQLAVQALLAGSAVLLLAAPLAGAGAAAPALAGVAAAASAVHALLALGEASIGHATEHARVAAREMTRGRFAPFFWGGFALTLGGVLSFLAPPLGGALALAGLLAHEHAFVQAGQSVPLA
jgi:Fe-S-cluster-containing dehydrogenase component/formate-dependent nitrite reductase membrane component NrfD